jgi:hypothetical protein
MASTPNNNPVESAQLKGPVREFAAFCETEREHRRNADPNFDAELYNKAVILVLDRLAAFKKEAQQ